ncbi:xylulokinase [Devosia sp. RR2S18]|uniref:xylulokinase n=1 Tax=Devosia rhizosphaerae TaxID=3049774 RepID=UPI00253F8A15|nr:FGGY family carbohydrate kinase [Devosia sp. RR2S18]WIJ23995.1 FGGY-family carbohydrate kinase [Devosia sp. RR2S18]
MNFTLIGIDVGTTATKATLIDAQGRELASFSRPHGTDRSGPGKAEQSAGVWMQSVLAALQHFADHADLSNLAGIGLTSQVNTHLFVDSAGAPLRPAITWQDTRSAADAAHLDHAVTAEQKTAWFGGPVPIDASHALSRMAFMARTEPERWARTRHVLLPKDFCAFQLTGELASDPVSATGLVDSKGSYVNALLELVPGARQRLPPLFPFHHAVGRVKAGLPCAGTPVMVGAMDAWAGMFGCGVIEEGDMMYQSGTSEVAGIVSSQVVPTPGVILFPPYQGIRMHAAPTQAGGASIAWLSALLGRSPQDLSLLAERLNRSETIPFFLPHLAGERAPVWDAASRGVFARLDESAGPGHLAHAVMEGVAHSVRWAFAALEKSADLPLGNVRIGGGGSRSNVWCQIRADVLGTGMQRAAVPAAAALGAAIIAGVGCGAFSSLTNAVRQLVQYDREFLPDAGRIEYYKERHGHFLALYESIAPFNQRF